jgi:hypothetical protein
MSGVSCAERTALCLRVVHAYRNKRQATVFILPAQLDQVREPLDARSAPGGPDIRHLLSES